MPILNEADIHLQEGRVDVAIQIYQEALAANPAEIDAIKGLARCAEVLGLGRQAEEAWLQVHQIDPQDLDGLMRKGLQYQRAGRYSEAIGCFADVVSRAPDPLDAHRARLNVCCTAIIRVWRNERPRNAHSATTTKHSGLRPDSLRTTRIQIGVFA